MHVKLGHRVYNAISTLLYATISMSKVTSLEKFIQKKASTLPTDYNGNDWAKICTKQYRMQNVYDVQRVSAPRGDVGFWIVQRWLSVVVRVWMVWPNWQLSTGSFEPARA